MIATSQNIDPQAALDFIVRHQQSRETACTYIGTKASEIQRDLEGLDQHWLETVRASVSADGQITGVVIIEWDRKMDRSWVYGPWIEEAAWESEGPALLAAATEQAPVSNHEMYADIANERMAWLAAQNGWQSGEANFEYLRTSHPASETVPSSIRPATCEDEVAIRQLHDREFPGTYALASALVDPASKYSTLVFAVEGHVLGFVASQLQDESTVYIDFVAVHPAGRRQRVGANLVDAAQHSARRERVALTVDENRPEARAFYDSLGFTVTAATRPYRQRQ